MNWKDFKKTPGWEEYFKGIDDGVLKVIEIEERYYEAGHVIYEAGHLPRSFFVIKTGEVVEEVKRKDGQVWFRPSWIGGTEKHYFGQRDLFGSRVRRSTAIVAKDMVGWALSGAGLRVIEELQEDPEVFREALLQEKIAARLRGIPLFRTLTGEEIRWLALVCEENTFAKGEKLNLDDRGIWIIDCGQIDVSGPVAEPHDSWRLTAGSFFLTPDALSYSDCTATSARVANYPSHLLFLPMEQMVFPLRTTPDIASLLEEPLDIANVLRKSSFLNAMVRIKNDLDNEERFQHLAQFCSREFVPTEQSITTQGDIGYSFVIIHRGEAIVRSLDKKGRLRPSSVYEEGAHFGSSSLLRGERRDATVSAVPTPGLDGAEIVILDRRDMRQAFKEKPKLWGPSVPLVKESRFTEPKLKKHKYDWMKEDEILVWDGRRHPIWLIIRVLTITFVLALLFILWQQTGAYWGLAVLTFPLLAALAWFIIDYFNDYYAITNRRVTRRDNVLLIYRQRTEIPLSQIEDTSVHRDFIGNVLNYGTVIIRSAAATVPISFEDVLHPEAVRRKVTEQQSESTAAEIAERREAAQKGLLQVLETGILTPPRTSALGPCAPSPTQASTPSGLAKILSRIFAKFSKKTPADDDRIVWRKHKINLLQRAGVQGFFFLILLGFGIYYQVNFGAFGGMGLAIWLVLLVFLGLWFTWEFADYRNDQYIVTNELIIDEEVKPLRLGQDRKITKLDRVQSVRAVQSGPWQYIFNYGKVIIRTASSDQQGLDFLFIPNPRNVQNIIHQRMGQARLKQIKEDADRERDILTETLKIYDDLKQEQDND